MRENENSGNFEHINCTDSFLVTSRPTLDHYLVRIHKGKITSIMVLCKSLWHVWPEENEWNEILFLFDLIFFDLWLYNLCWNFYLFGTLIPLFWWNWILPPIESSFYFR